MGKIKIFVFSFFIIFSFFTLASLVFGADPTCMVQANPSGVAPGGSSTISWTSTNADHCSSPNTSQTGISGMFSVNNITSTNNYSVSCTRDAQTSATAGSCSGTAYNVPAGYCGGYQVSGSSCGGVMPGSDEGTYCNNFETEAECHISSDPWCHHPCHWVAGNTQEQCDVNEAEVACESHPTCTWTPSPIPATTVNCSTTVSLIDITADLGNGSQQGPVGSTAQIMVSHQGSQTCQITSNYPLSDEDKDCQSINPIYTFIVPMSVAGSYYFTATATYPSGGNGNDTDNVTITPAPDLTASIPTPATATPGTSVNFQTNITNNGTASTGAGFNVLFQTATHFNDNGIPQGLNQGTSSEPNIQVTSTAALGAGAARSVSKTFTTSGTARFIRACADMNASMVGTINEGTINEGNNCSAWRQLVSLPDLTASTPTSNPATPIPGTVTFFSNISNIGNGSTLSTFNNVFQTATGFNDDGVAQGVVKYLASPTPMPILNNGATNVASVAIPWTAADIFVRACADKDIEMVGTEVESVESNNCSAWRQLIALPDLTASIPIPATATPGTVVTFSSTVTNSGTVATETGFRNLFQTATGFDDNGFPEGVTDRPVAGEKPVLNGGATTVIGTSISLASDDYYVRACADKSSSSNQGVITESNENNNCSPWRQLVTSADLPNLVASIITPTNVLINTTTTFSSTITNIGPVSTESVFYNFFQVSDGTTVYDVPNPVQLGPLGPSESGVIEKSHRFTSVGIFYVRACADKSNSASLGDVPESNEYDNCGGWTTITVEDPTVVPVGVDITAYPMAGFPGDTTLLEWTVTGSPTSCTAYFAWTGSKAFTNGTHTELVTLPATPGAQARYMIFCQRGSSSLQDSVYVDVLNTNTLVDGQCGYPHWRCTKGDSKYTGDGNDGTNWIWVCEGKNGGVNSPTCSEAMSGVCAGDTGQLTDYPDCKCKNTANNPPICTTYPASCYDGVQNNGETGKDCGGPNCPSCRKIPWWKEL